MAKAGVLEIDVHANTVRFQTDMAKGIKMLNEMGRTSEEAARKLDRIESSGRKSARSLDGMSKTLGGVSKTVGGLSGTMGGLGNTITGFLAVFAVDRIAAFAGGVIHAADAFNQLQGRVKNAIGEAGNFDKVFGDLIAASNRSGGALDNMASNFAKLKNATRDLGTSNSDIIRFIETFQKMGAVSGANTEEMKNALHQLTQGIGGSVLQMNDLNSVLDQMPSVGRAIAESMGIPFSVFRKAVEDGQVTAEVVMDAILSKTAEVDQQFAALPASVERSMNEIGNLFSTMVGQLNETSNITNILSDSLSGLAGWLRANQTEIVQTSKFLLGMGETAIQAGKVVSGYFISAFTTVTKIIIESVQFGMQGFQNLVRGAAGAVNQVIGLANKLPGVDLKNVGTNFKMPGLGLVKGVSAKNEQIRQFGMGMTLNNLKALFGGKSRIYGSGGINISPARWGMPKQATLRQFSGTKGNNKKKSGSGKAKKTTVAPKAKSKSGSGSGLRSVSGSNVKTQEQRDYASMESDARNLTQSVRTIWEVEAEAIQKADAYLQKHLISQQTYDRAVAEAHQTAKEGFKLEGLHEAIEKFAKPGNDWIEKMSKSLTEQDTAWEEVQRVIESTLTPLEKYNQQVQYLNYLHENAGLSSEAFSRAMLQADEELKQTTKSSNSFGESIANWAGSTVSGAFDMITQKLGGAKASFKDFVASALTDLARLIFQLTVVEPLVRGISGIFGGGKSSGGGGGGVGATAAKVGGSILGSIAKKIFHFADGGEPPVGVPSLVGERGPELFVPKTAGTIIPNHQISTGGGGSISVTNVFNISTGVQQTVRAEIMQIMPQIEKRTTSAVKTAVERGGSMAATVGRKS